MEQLAGGTELDVSATSSSLDASSKWWLMVFAVAAVVTIVVLARSFFSALAPPQEVVNKLQQSPPVRTVHAISQPVWDAGQQSRSTGYSDNIPPSPPSERKAGAAWVTPTNWAGIVHTQAEYLRKQAEESKDPSDVKRMALERIDEMEKRGVLVQ
jgi:hypothetical protein